MNYLLIISVTFAAVFTALIYLFAFTNFIYQRQLRVLNTSFETIDSANRVINKYLELQKEIELKNEKIEQFIEIIKKQQQELDDTLNEDLPY